MLTFLSAFAQTEENLKLWITVFRGNARNLASCLRISEGASSPPTMWGSYSQKMGNVSSVYTLLRGFVLENFFHFSHREACLVWLTVKKLNDQSFIKALSKISNAGRSSLFFVCFCFVFWLSKFLRLSWVLSSHYDILIFLISKKLSHAGKVAFPDTLSPQVTKCHQYCLYNNWYMFTVVDKLHVTERRPLKSLSNINTH